MQLDIPQIPVLERGKVFTEKDYVYSNFFDSPHYGRLHLKHDDYNERHIFMNKLLKDIYVLYALTMEEHIQLEMHSYQHGHFQILFMIESIVYWLRKNIDEMIAFNYYAYYFAKKGEEPKKLQIASIGTLLNHKNNELYSVFASHLKQLNRINEISNTYKHSFISSEAHSLIGKDEPVVNCLDIHHNNAVNEPVWHSYYLREIVGDYISFFNLSREKLKAFKLPSRQAE
jgi:hypothetical protein